MRRRTPNVDPMSGQDPMLPQDIIRVSCKVPKEKLVVEPASQRVLKLKRPAGAPHTTTGGDLH